MLHRINSVMAYIEQILLPSMMPAQPHLQPVLDGQSRADSVYAARVSSLLQKRP
ncbi:MAG: hypothetical protein NTW99_14675 [Chloroflexi bacterium]|nr:hypothetical protein [Chloroflexota bacterium]